MASSPNFVPSTGSTVVDPISGVSASVTAAGVSGLNAEDVQGVPGGTAIPAYIQDGISTAKATVAQFHNADNQNPGGAANGVLTGGVAQLINPLGNLDRQKETSVDNSPALGIVTGAQQLATPFTVTSSTAITAGQTNKVITVSAVSGTNRGAAWSLQVGSIVTIDTGANAEPALVTAVVGSTITLMFSGASNGAKFNHSGTYNVASFTYNQARDATTPDGSTGAGFQAGATYLFNGSLNSGAGGWESERSANGELDGASGVGTAVAAEYEFNGGLPGGSFDRARNLQAKGYQTQTIVSGGGSGSTSVTLSAGAVPQVGQMVYFTDQTFETAYVSAVAGQVLTLVTALTSGVAHTACAWDIAATNGPALNGFTPGGIGIEEECVFDPVTSKYFIERSHTQDGIALANVVSEGVVLFNGATGDRLTGKSGVANVSTGGNQTVAIAAGAAGNTTVKASAGRLCKILVTTVGTNAMQFTDGAAGTIIAVIPASAAVGTFVDVQMPAATSIIAVGNAANPAVTVSYV